MVSVTGEEFTGAEPSPLGAVPRNMAYPVVPESVPALQVRITSWVPVPESNTDWGLPSALSTMFNEAVRLPAPDGVMRMAMLQLPPGANDEPHIFAWLKSAASLPAKEILVMFKAALPELVRLTTCGEVVRVTDSSPNPRLAADKLAVGELGDVEAPGEELPVEELPAEVLPEEPGAVPLVGEELTVTLPADLELQPNTLKVAARRNTETRAHGMRRPAQSYSGEV